jgi:hypothetical protein
MSNDRTILAQFIPEESPSSPEERIVDVLQITKVIIVWEVARPGEHKPAETHLKGNTLPHMPLNALFNRKGRGYLKVYYKDNPQPHQTQPCQRATQANR